MSIAEAFVRERVTLCCKALGNFLFCCFPGLMYHQTGGRHLEYLLSFCLLLALAV